MSQEKAPCLALCVLRLSLLAQFWQCVEGQRWGPWAREGLEEARVFTGDEPCHREGLHCAPARFDTLQRVIHCALGSYAPPVLAEPQRGTRACRLHTLLIYIML